jgi:hypothetical protein
MAQDTGAGTPQPPAGPPPAPPPSGPAVRIGEWFTEAWNLIQPVWIEYILVILLFQVVVGVAYLLCVLPGLLVIGPMLGGVFVYCGKRALGEPAEVTDLFKGFERFGPTLVLGLVIFLIPMVVLGIAFLPALFSSIGLSAAEQSGATGARDFFGALSGLSGCLGCVVVPLLAVVYPIVVGTLFIFAFPLVMFENLSAMEALKRSTNLVLPKFWGFLGFLVASWLLQVVAGSVGGILICIGALILSPLAMAMVTVAQVLAYRDFVGLTPENVEAYR